MSGFFCGNILEFGISILEFNFFVRKLAGLKFYSTFVEWNL